MCGIVGVYNQNGEPADPAVLRRMLDMVAYRGPDGSSVHLDGPLGLGHTRLSVIDLASGQQPMSNEDGSLWITFNGEIFNYLELREELIAQGHHFATQSDTEVVLHLYEERGEDCVRWLNGQWAFAIWDARKKSLLLSRDRMGIRPLFYTSTGHTLLFASEIKSLFCHPDVQRRMDAKGLDQLFTFWFTIPPRTVFSGILELPPGCSATVRGGEIQLRQFWNLEYGPGNGCDGDEQRYSDELYELLLDATRIQLRSDVPVAAYLSGGLDSTGTAALIRNVSHQKLATFSVRFTDPEYDESPYQHEAARLLEAERHEINCSYHDIARVFPRVVWHAETPVLRAAPAPMYLLAQLVHEAGLKVVLTGEGSDEVLGGYDIYKETKVRTFWGVDVDSQFRPLLLRRLYPYMGGLQREPVAYLKAFFQVTQENLASPFFSHLPRWKLTSTLKAFFSDDLRSELGDYDAIAELHAGIPPQYHEWNHFSQAQYLETKHLLPGYILSSQGDRMAMAHSVEVRHPFLDYRVVEFANRLPVCLKMKVLNEKYLLKKAVAGLVPSSIVKRPKQPYRTPDGRSFFTRESTPDYVHEMLSTAKVRRHGLFRSDMVCKLVEKFASGHAMSVKDDMALIGILSTQLLVDSFIDNWKGRSGWA